MYISVDADACVRFGKSVIVILHVYFWVRIVNLGLICGRETNKFAVNAVIASMCTLLPKHDKLVASAA